MSQQVINTRIDPETNTLNALTDMPKPGDTFVLFGIEYFVNDVEPQTDWTWRVEATTVLPIAGAREYVVLIVPADALTN